MLTRNFVFVFAFVFAALSTVSGGGFVKTRGSQFVLNGKPFYLSGFNAYWLMQMASDPSNRYKVSDVFQQASKYRMNLARTWAFSDGGSNPLQTSPGSYNENMFKGLDFVVSEAKKHGIYLILSFVNNWEPYGGKKQYVQWGRIAGQRLVNDDDFFRNWIVKGYYKNHVKRVLTRVNSLTGVDYKDEPTILGWELINEPHCESDLSGKTIQDWITEMADYIKSIDKNHLVEIGLEGFYGDSIPQKKQNNPGYGVGTDFISNNHISNVDFATIHLYPDQWVPNWNEKAQDEFVWKWINSHIDDSKWVIRKPLLLAEFGKSSKSSGYSVGARDKYFESIYNNVLFNARKGWCGGAVFWQLMVPGMESWSDGYEVVLEQSPSTAAVVYQQSRQITSLNK